MSELNGYQIVKIGQDEAFMLREAIVEFWRAWGAIRSHNQAEHRVQQVSCVVMDPMKMIVGVSSIYVMEINENKYAAGRMFISPPSRSFAILQRLFKATEEQAYRLRGSCKGMIFVGENWKISRNGYKKWLARRGWSALESCQVKGSLFFKGFENDCPE